MKNTILHIISLVVGGCRIIVGLLVINAGYRLTQHQGAFSFWNRENSMSGLFVILLGIAFIALAIFPKSFGRSE